MSKQTTVREFRTSIIRRMTMLALFCMMYILGFAKNSKADSLSVVVMNIEIQLNTERHDIEILQKEMAIYEKSLRCIDEHVDRVNEEICNQISSSSHTIQVWGWVMAVIAIVVTILMSIVGVKYARYINKLRKNIALLSSEAKKKYQQIKEVSDKMDETQKKILTQQQDIQAILDTTDQKIMELQVLYSDIQKSSQKIYASMKREETRALLTHLVNVPEDIYNISTILLSRVLEKEDFQPLFQAYHNLITRTSTLYDNATAVQLREKLANYRKCENEYLTLFAQHFMQEVVETSELRELVRPFFKELFAESFFMNDAEKSTVDFKKGVSSLDTQLQTELIKDYILAMSLSKYSKFKEWYKILLSDLSESQLEEIWYGVTKDNANALYFAQTIKAVIEVVNPQSALLNKVVAYMVSKANVEEKSE